MKQTEQNGRTPFEMGNPSLLDAPDGDQEATAPSSVVGFHPASAFTPRKCHARQPHTKPRAMLVPAVLQGVGLGLATDSSDSANRSDTAIAAAIELCPSMFSYRPSASVALRWYKLSAHLFELEAKTIFHLLLPCHFHACGKQRACKLQHWCLEPLRPIVFHRVLHTSVLAASA